MCSRANTRVSCPCTKGWQHHAHRRSSTHSHTHSHTHPHTHTHTRQRSHSHTRSAAHPPTRCRRQGRKAASCTDNVTDARLPDEGGSGRVVTSHVCQAIVVPSDVVGHRAAVSSQPVSLADRLLGEPQTPPCPGAPRVPSPPASPERHRRRHRELRAGRRRRAPRAVPPRRPRAARHRFLLQVGGGWGGTRGGAGTRGCAELPLAAAGPAR